jgi:hypothetical protein
MPPKNPAVLLCFFFFLVVYGLTARAELQVSDEVAVFTTGVSLATQGDLAIDELQWLQDAVNIGQKGRNGQLYAKYFPGNVLCTAVIYRLAAKQNDSPYIWNYKALAPSVSSARLVMTLNAVFGAFAMTVLLLLLSRHFDWRTAVTTTALIGLGSDWWYQSRGFLSEVGAGAFLIASLYFADRNKPYLSGLALALSLLFRPTNLAGLPIWGYGVWRNGPKAIWSGLSILASLAILAGYNWVRFESAFTFGYAQEGFNGSLFQGLYGLTLSPGRSLFVYSPILILAAPGGWLMYKKERDLALVCLSAVLGYVIAIALWHSWDGGWSWGSRLLTPILPISGLFLAPVVEISWKNLWRGLPIVILALTGFGIQILALARDPLRVMNEQVASGAIPYEATLYSLDHAWIAMQFRSLQNWQRCDLDSYTLRQLLGHCQPL